LISWFAYKRAKLVTVEQFLSPNLTVINLNKYKKQVEPRKMSIYREEAIDAIIEALK